jgi:hypothetical protein
MRKWLSTLDIARLADRTRAYVWSKAKAGQIPGQRAKNRGKRIRYLDGPEIRAWYKTERDRVNQIELWLDIIELTVHAVRERDLDKIMRWEMRRQIRESKDPDQLVKKWQRASVRRCSEDLPRFNLARAARHIFAEVWRQLDESKDPVQLVRKWQRALVSGHLEDLPHVTY